MKTKWKDIPLILRVVALIALISLMGTVIFQAVAIHNMKESQEEQFRAHIASAKQSFEEYQETGYGFMYDDALMELHSASSVALLLQDDDAYQGVHGVLLSIIGTHHSFPEDLALYIDELIEVLDDFETHHNAENLYTKLKVIDNRLTAMLADRLEKVE